MPLTNYLVPLGSTRLMVSIATLPTPRGPFATEILGHRQRQKFSDFDTNEVKKY